MIRMRVTAQAKRDTIHLASIMDSPRISLAFIKNLHKTLDAIAMTPTIGDLVRNVSQNRYPRLRHVRSRSFDLMSSSIAQMTWKLLLSEFWMGDVICRNCLQTRMTEISNGSFAFVQPSLTVKNHSSSDSRSSKATEYWCASNSAPGLMRRTNPSCRSCGMCECPVNR